MIVMKSLRSLISRNSRYRVLLWAALAGLFFGITDLGQPIESNLLVARNTLRQHPASGEIVIIAIDDRSLRLVDSWPWPRRIHGQLAERLSDLGAERIAFDIDFSSRSTPEEDRRFAESLAGIPTRVTIAARFVIDPVSGERVDLLPLPEFRRHVDLANINARYNFQGIVWSLPYAMELSGSLYPSLAASLSQRPSPDSGGFRLDYAIDPRTIPTVSAVDVLQGTAPRSVIEGKRVIIGSASLQAGDIYYLPGYGQIPGAYLQGLGAETLIEGHPLDLGWLAPFVLSIIVVGFCIGGIALRRSIAVLSGAAVGLTAITLFLESHQVFLTIVPSLVVLLGSGAAYAWKAFREAYRVRGMTNLVSGLPNLNALRELPAGQDQPLIVAKIHNYAEILSAFPADAERLLVEQIAARFAVGNPSTIYEGDEGVFAWFADHHDLPLLGEYLDGLHALLLRPITIAGNQISLTVSFGFDAMSPRAPINRLASALLAAESAAAEGMRWKQHDAAHGQRAAWKLAILSELETGIDSGDLWVAYQPKVDIASMRIVGAEALARWTHPAKGEISPTEFVQAAEQSGRIEKLTNFVLDQAIRSAAAINHRGTPFGISVNISARMISNYTLIATVTELLNHHGLAPSLLTLEVTETAAISSTSAALVPLRDLRNLGVQISIDDYGTGLSTLEYIKRMPATEIKIDKQFIQSVSTTESDRIMVQSTIRLAHSLGQKVVAEGVEDLETLRILKAMDCDLAQGFFTGRPMTYRRLAAALKPERKEQAA